MRKSWIKFTERECDFLTSYCIMLGYLRRYRENVGRNFKNLLVLHEKGIVRSFRLQSEYNDFLYFLKNNPQYLEPALNRLSKINIKLNSFLQLRGLDRLDAPELLNLFKTFVSEYQSYFALFTLPKYYGMVINKNHMNGTVKKKLYTMRSIADYEKIQTTFLPLLFKEISRRAKCNTELLQFALPNEIAGFLRSGQNFNISSLRKRAKVCLLLARGGRICLYTGKEAKRIYKENILSEEIISFDTITGHVANNGYVSGVVKKILREKDLTNIKVKDKIIVAPMTSIKFVPYLKNIKAIITDEGGIACHAAIISRELNVPCIIGTKIATEVLKDGDLVEVDADKGVVNILKRK